MLAVASRLCGVHAQLMSSAELTLWARVDGLEADAVSRALWEDRSLVKTWAMRGTLHLLPSSELGLWLAGLGTYSHYTKPGWFRGFGITPEQLDAVLAAVTDALEARELTREELIAEIVAVSGSDELGTKVGESWGSLLKPAAFQGRICFAPSDGQKVRFTRPDAWLRGVPDGPADGDTALSEITRRYLAVHGPGTRDDFARWWMTTPAAAGKLLRSLEDAIEVDAEGTPMWMLALEAEAAATAPPPEGVRLLPAFDQYVIAATRHAEPLLPAPELRDRVYRPQGWLSPVLLVEGRMAGVWRSERKSRRVVVEIEPFKRVTKAVRAEAESEAERLATFLDGELALTWA
jgi:hypothetical protein